MAVNYQQAEQIAADWLKQQPNQAEVHGGVSLKLDSTIEKPYGWVFFYNTKEFLETGNRLAALGGNAPIMVEKATGQIYITGTAHPLDHYLADYERFHPHRLSGS